MLRFLITVSLLISPRFILCSCPEMPEMIHTWNRNSYLARAIYFEDRTPTINCTTITVDGNSVRYSGDSSPNPFGKHANDSVYLFHNGKWILYHRYKTVPGKDLPIFNIVIASRQDSATKEVLLEEIRMFKENFKLHPNSEEVNFQLFLGEDCD